MLVLHNAVPIFRIKSQQIDIFLELQQFTLFLLSELHCFLLGTLKNEHAQMLDY